MNLRPVIEREFRVASRLKATYNNRSTFGALMLLLAGPSIYFGWELTRTNDGELLFLTLHTAVFCSIWVFVPIGTADVISREKRDDTLGLLLLTPLRAWEVAAAKWLAAFLSSLPLMLAALPFFVLPLMLGGVSVWDVLRALLVDLSALVGAVTAGVVASALCERRGRAWLLVLVVGAFLWFAVHTFHGFLLAGWAAHLSGNRFSLVELLQFIIQQPEYLPVLSFALATGSVGHVWRSGEFGSTPMVVLFSVLGLLFAALLAGSGIRFTGLRIARFSESRFLSPRRERIQRTYTRERFFKVRLSRAKRRLMEKNPVAWYHQRRWSSRLTKWGWLLVVVGALSYAARHQRMGGIFELGVWLLGILLVSLLLVSSVALTQERDSGVLELLFSTALSPTQYVQGRLVSIWKCYLPSVALILLISWGAPLMITGFPDRSIDHLMVMLYVTVFFGTVLGLFIFLPMIGLYCSMTGRGMLNSFVTALFLSVLVPWGIPLGLWIVALGAQSMNHSGGDPGYLAWLLIGIWVVATGGLQAASVIAVRRGRMPRLWPNWMSRWRLTLLLPWVLPLISWGLLEWKVDEWIRYSYMTYFWMILLWQCVAIWLLVQTACCARRELIRILDDRSFVTS